LAQTVMTMTITIEEPGCQKTLSSTMLATKTHTVS